MNVRTLTTAMLLSVAFAVSSQIPTISGRKRMTEIMARDVKSLDEFGARFNGKESHPDIPADSADSRLKNIGALFDVTNDTPLPLRLQVLSFCDSVIKHHVEFSLMSRGVFAVAQTTVEYRKKKYTVSVILQQERPQGRYARWGIVGVTGLLKSGIIGSVDLHDISPVDHELRFMSLNDVLNENRGYAYGYRQNEREIDELTAFLTMVYTGALTIDSVQDTRLYVTNVPGFIYTISEFGEKSGKSGWVITELMAASDEEKEAFIKNLLIE